MVKQRSNPQQSNTDKDLKWKSLPIHVQTAMRNARERFKNFFLKAYFIDGKKPWKAFSEVLHLIGKNMPGDYALIEPHAKLLKKNMIDYASNQRGDKKAQIIKELQREGSPEENKDAMQIDTFVGQDNATEPTQLDLEAIFDRLRRVGLPHEIETSSGLTPSSLLKLLQFCEKLSQDKNKIKEDLRAHKSCVAELETKYFRLV